MKQKDIITIIIAVAISAVVSILVTKLTFASPKVHQQSVEVVPSISTDFPTPDSLYFNSSSIDPTQLIHIGNSNNPAPFPASSTSPNT